VSVDRMFQIRFCSKVRFFFFFWAYQDVHWVLVFLWSILWIIAYSFHLIEKFEKSQSSSQWSIGCGYGLPQVGVGGAGSSGGQ